MVELAERFLLEPLYQRDWRRAFGTLYTVGYDCRRGSVHHRWPEVAMDQSFDRFQTGVWTIDYERAASPRVGRASAGSRAENAIVEPWLASLLTDLRCQAGSSSTTWVDPLARSLAAVCSGGAVDWRQVVERWMEQRGEAPRPEQQVPAQKAPVQHDR